MQSSMRSSVWRETILFWRWEKSTILNRHLQNVRLYVFWCQWFPWLSGGIWKWMLQCRTWCWTSERHVAKFMCLHHTSHKYIVCKTHLLYNKGIRPCISWCGSVVIHSGADLYMAVASLVQPNFSCLENIVFPIVTRDDAPIDRRRVGNSPNDTHQRVQPPQKSFCGFLVCEMQKAAA